MDYPRYERDQARGPMFAGTYFHVGGWGPCPSEFLGRSMNDAPLLFVRAPFLSAEGLRDPDLICTYATASGELRGGQLTGFVLLRLQPSTRRRE